MESVGTVKKEEIDRSIKYFFHFAFFGRRVKTDKQPSPQQRTNSQPGQPNLQSRQRQSQVPDLFSSSSPHLPLS